MRGPGLAIVRPRCHLLHGTIVFDAPGIIDFGCPLGWEAANGVPSRMGPAWHSSRARVAMTGSPSRTHPSTASPPILCSLPQ